MKDKRDTSVHHGAGRLTRARISERLSMETMEEWYGPRCEDWNADCLVCQNWDRFNAIDEQIEEVRQLKQQMLGARIKAEEMVFQQLKDHADLVKWCNEGDKAGEPDSEGGGQ